MTTVQELIDELEGFNPETSVALVLRQRMPLQFSVGAIEEFIDYVYIATGTEQGYVQDERANRAYAT